MAIHKRVTLSFQTKIKDISSLIQKMESKIYYDNQNSDPAAIEALREQMNRLIETRDHIKREYDSLEIEELKED